MISHWLSRQNSETLLVFCNGWGMDYHPFAPLVSRELDVLLLYDYKELDLPEDFDRTLSRYENRYLMCWSMGVWAGQQLFCQNKELFCQRIAVNGTMQPIHDHFGIPCKIYDTTLREYSEKVQERFYRRMCREKSVLSAFLAVRPRRGVEEQKEELACLRSMIRERDPGESIYTNTIISENDLIIPAASQKAFWSSTRILVIDGCHFPFFRWQTWNDMLAQVESHG